VLYGGRGLRGYTDMIRKTTQGKRVEDNLPAIFLCQGDYGRTMLDGKWVWYCMAPAGGSMRGNLSAHNVIEHEDGTITVSPSILISGGLDMKQSRHGHLTKGIWKEC